MSIFLSTFGVFLAWSGAIFVYDARPLTKKLFGFGDQNEATLGFKIIGFLFLIIGGFLLYFNLNK